jgi:hypothetical protein
MQRDNFIEKENPKGVSSQSTHKTASSFVLNRAPIEVTPVKRLPFGNLTENTPTSVCSRVIMSGGKDHDHHHGNHSRGSIFSGPVRVPKREKQSPGQTNVTPSSDPSSHQGGTPRASAHVVTPGSGSGAAAGSASATSSGKKSTSGHKNKHSYMKTTEAYR